MGSGVFLEFFFCFFLAVKSVFVIFFRFLLEFEDVWLRFPSFFLGIEVFLLFSRFLLEVVLSLG